MTGPDPEPPVVALLGEDGVARIVAAFYRRVATDDLLRPMYPDDLAPAEQRLRDFLVYRFGGSPRYVEQRGHPRLRRRHFPFPIDRAARDRWVARMGAALDECAVPDDLAAWLRGFFGEVATFLENR